MHHHHDATQADVVEDLLTREAREHDRQYSTATPFGLPTLKFTPDDVWRVNDLAFKKGTYRRGRRKRRLFELLELDKISGKKILDVGCGTGQHTVFFALYGAESFGFDLSPVGVALGERMAEINAVADLCHFAVASASDLPYDDAFFDVVVLNAVLHHIVKYPNVREEIWRVLRPGGKLLIADGLREDPMYRALRRCHRAIRSNSSVNVEDAGDVDMTSFDLKEFMTGYTISKRERFTLLEGLREGFARYYDNPLHVRAMIFMLFAADQVLLNAIPPLRRHTSEYIILAEKPLHGA